MLSQRNRVLCSGVILDKNTRLSPYTKIYDKTSIRGSRIGTGTYIGWNGIFDFSDIGNFCSIGPCVEVIYGRHPLKDYVSTHPAFFSVNKQCGFTFSEKTKFIENRKIVGTDFSIKIGHDVWIGYGSKILEGVTIGTGAVIGAGSLVTKNIEPYAIYAGNPARFIRYRFDEDTRLELLKSAWWDSDFNWIESNSELFDNIELFIDEVNFRKSL